ncbi:MAG: hypothetical protein ACUVTH_14480 [Thermogutta sp.]
MADVNHDCSAPVTDVPPEDVSAYLGHPRPEALAHEAATMDPPRPRLPASPGKIPKF